MNWQKKAKQRMKELGIKQHDLIPVLGVKTRGAVGHYLTGRRELRPEQLKALAKKLECSLDWLTEENGSYLSPITLETEETKVNELKTKLKQSGLIYKEAYYIPCIKWHEIRAFTESDYSKEQEFEMMPVMEKLMDGSFSVQIENSQYSPYLNENDIIVVEPAESTLNHRVLAEINGQYHIMEHVLLEREYFFPKKTGAVPIPITDDLDYKILGIIKNIYSKRIG